MSAIDRSIDRSINQSKEKRARKRERSRERNLEDGEEAKGCERVHGLLSGIISLGCLEKRIDQGEGVDLGVEITRIQEIDQILVHWSTEFL